MSAILRTLAAAAAIAATPMLAADEGEAPAETSAKTTVVEVVTLNLADGVTVEQFAPVDRAVEEEHVSRQPGFVSREVAAGDDGSWLVIVHWASVEDAQASMDSFAAAPAVARFMEMIDAESMRMTRYDVVATDGE